MGFLSVLLDLVGAYDVCLCMRVFSGKKDVRQM